MKIKFQGVPGEDHAQLTMYGQTFPLGRWVEVEEPIAQRRLSNHPHFEVKKGDEVEQSETAPVLPQSIPVVEREYKVTSGDATVYESEVQQVNDDPMMQEANLRVGFNEVLEHKQHGNDPDPGPASSEKARGAGRPRKPAG